MNVYWFDQILILLNSIEVRKVRIPLPVGLHYGKGRQRCRRSRQSVGREKPIGFSLQDVLLRNHSKISRD